MKRSIIALLSVLIGLVSSCALAENENTFSTEQGIAGVACIITDPAGRLVLVKDNVTGRYGLPGGRVNLAESPTRALAREVFEETAIRVTVGEVYHKDNRGVLFACQSQAPLPVVSKADGTGFLPVWRAPHFASEIDEAYLVPAVHADDYRYRFNGRGELLWSLAAKAPSSDVTALADFSALAPTFYVSQYGLVTGVQQAVAMMGDTASVLTKQIFRLVNTLGETAFYVALVPLFLIFRGHKSALSLLFLLISAAAVSTTLKTGFAMPRPFYLWPNLQIGEASGFTVPSGHTLLAAAVMTAWYLKRRVNDGPAYGSLVIALGVVTLMGLNRMYLGVHFASDVIIGALVGASVAWATVNMDAMTIAKGRPLLTTGRMWLLICSILALLALALKLPNLVYLAALAAGVYTGQVWHKLFPSHKPATSFKGKLLTLAWIFLGAGGMIVAAWCVTQLTGLSWIVLIIVSMSAWSLGPWVLIASPELAKWSGARLGWCNGDKDTW
ncbi:phosphatase PAP2 family protein [Salinivibrio sp. ES.052]|uniref:phosphatase PAP2 family protein n=1 Tax=Salinivibrio sp. ES.052 TaxID=1882823 RepID=UPI000928AD50|nr:phosphatase PAP2 family protein [Salinivibrio sp. ES.052]SIN82122.1 ADP-ribose pyrophosphatase YjhB, NUDIX family [Salinivibrio sp. ES.052]